MSCSSCERCRSPDVVNQTISRRGGGVCLPLACRPVASRRVRLLVFLIQLGLHLDRFTTIPSRASPGVTRTVPSAFSFSRERINDARRASLRQQIHEKEHRDVDIAASQSHADTHAVAVRVTRKQIQTMTSGKQSPSLR